MTTLDLRPSGLPIISTRGATRTVRFVFGSDQTGNVFAAYIATRINSVAHVANLNVSVSGVTVTMTISAAATVLAAGAEHYWVLTRNGEPLLYDILEVSSIPGAPTTSTVSVEYVTAAGAATVLVSGASSGGLPAGLGDALYVWSNAGMTMSFDTPDGSEVITSLDHLSPIYTGNRSMHWNNTAKVVVFDEEGVYQFAFGGAFTPNDGFLNVFPDVSGIEYDSSQGKNYAYGLQNRFVAFGAGAYSAMYLPITYSVGDSVPIRGYGATAAFDGNLNLSYFEIVCQRIG